MTTLHLGVVEFPYAHEPPEAKAKAKPSDTPNVTTGDVAEILEEKYHVMRIFFELHAKEITKTLESGLSASLEALLSGAPPPKNAFQGAEEKIGEQFRQFLSSKEMEKIGYPGVPTKAALAGVNHRLKHPYAKTNKPRPSFIDTGLYQKSFRAWVD